MLQLNKVGWIFLSTVGCYPLSGEKKKVKTPNPCLISLLLIIFGSCTAKGKEEGQGQDNSGCIIRVIPPIAHDYVCVSKKVNWGSIVILLPKLKSGSAALKLFGESFVCLFSNLLSIFHSLKEKTTLSLWSGLYLLFPYRSGGRGEAAWEVKRGQKASTVPGNNLSLHISSCSGFNVVNASAVMREGKEGRWDWIVGILGF